MALIGSQTSKTSQIFSTERTVRHAEIESDLGEGLEVTRQQVALREAGIVGGWVGGGGGGKEGEKMVKYACFTTRLLRYLQSERLATGYFPYIILEKICLHTKPQRFAISESRCVTIFLAITQLFYYIVLVVREKFTSPLFGLQGADYMTNFSPG